MEQRARDHLGKRLKELRKYKGWSADELAHESGVSIRTVSRLETAGVENPRETTLVRLARALGESREDLAGPRLSPEQIDQATQTQLDRIEGKLDWLVAAIRDGAGGPPAPQGELDRRVKEPKPTKPGRESKRPRKAQDDQADTG